MKTALVVLYNHNYEKNIPLIKKLYGDQFSEILQLMPYYYGDDADVFSVYGNSFQFHDYLIQARERIARLNADNILIIGDDLLLNPQFNESNAAELLGVKNDSTIYIDGFVDVSNGSCYRGLTEAHNFSTWPHGLDANTANRMLPSFEKARDILKARNLMQSEMLNTYAPFYLKWETGLKMNWKVFKARVYHFLKKCRYKFRPEKYAYPVVFGYSDILSIPKSQYSTFCDYLAVFSAWRTFVELAIPTVVLLMESEKNISISTVDTIPFKTGNVWSPQDPEHFHAMNALIGDLLESAGTDHLKLKDNYPSEYLYLHPVKLSRFSNSQSK